MENILEELWYGNINPQENRRINSKEMKELLRYISRYRESLEKSFTDEQKEVFGKLQDCLIEYMCLNEAAIFSYAFKLGGRIAVEIMGLEME